MDESQNIYSLDCYIDDNTIILYAIFQDSKGPCHSWPWFQ